MRRHVWGLLVVIALEYWTVRPLLGSGYFPMHDDTQVARVITMGRALLQGQFPVRWVSDLGYGLGYPLYNFYGPLPYYVGGALYAVGFDSIVATKAMMAVGLVLAGGTMYALVQSRLGRLCGILAGVLYAYAPYHAVQLYVRGAVGELWAYAFLPLLFLKNNPWVAGGALAAVILSHTITGYVTVVFYAIVLVLRCLVLLFTEKRPIAGITPSLLPLGVGLGISAFFWLPALFEMQYTSVSMQVNETANFRNHFVCLPQLWNSLWGYGGSAAGCIDGMSFKLGKLHILLGIAGIVWVFLRMRTFLLVGIGSLFMVLEISKGLWELLPGFAYVQYPWRFLTGIVLSLSVVGAGVMFPVRAKWMRVGVLSALLLITVGVNAKLFTPQKTYVRPASFFESDEEILWRVSKISDEYLPPSVQKPKTYEGVAKTVLSSDRDRGLFAQTEIDRGVYAKIHVQVAQSMDVVLNRAYFPGWMYWVNGARVIPRVENGLPRIIVPGNSSVIEMRFGDTPIRLIGNIITLGTFLWFLRIYGKETIA